MSSKEILDLMALSNSPAKTRLRNGKNINPAPVNSTNSEPGSIPPSTPSSEISSIPTNIPSSTASYRDSTATFEESPVGSGLGTQLGDRSLRNIRSSEDEYNLKDTLDAKIEALRNEVDWFAVDLVNEPGWQKAIPEQFDRISIELKSLLAKVSIIGEDINVPAIDTITELSKDLSNSRDKLIARAKTDTPSLPNPVLRRSNLSTHFEHCSSQSSSQQGNNTLTNEHHNENDVFLPDNNSTKDNNLSTKIVQIQNQLVQISSLSNKVEALEATITALNLEQQTFRAAVSDMDQSITTLFNRQKTLDIDMSGKLEVIQQDNLDLKKSIQDVNRAFQGIKLNVKENKKRAVQAINDISRISSSANESLLPPPMHNTSTNRSHVSQEALSVMEDDLKQITRKISLITAINLDETTSESHISSLITRDNPLIDKYTNLAYDKLAKYSNLVNTNPDIISSVKHQLTRAEEWSRHLINKYNSLGMHETQSSHRIAIEVTKFTEDSEQTVFEFLEDFDSCYRGRGSDNVKATQMWKTHLSASIQADTESIKTDLQAL